MDEVEFLKSSTGPILRGQIAIEKPMILSEDLMLKLRRAQDLESQKQKRSVGLEDTLAAVLNTYLSKTDPVKKAERQKVRGKLPLRKSKSPSSQLFSEQLVSASHYNKTDINKTRKPISAYTKHQVQLRDQGRCTHKDNVGNRCSSRRFLEIHHITPVSRGGDNSLDNLRVLCHGHHKVEHLKI